MSSRHAHDQAGPDTSTAPRRPLSGWIPVIISVLKATLVVGLIVTVWSIVQLAPWKNAAASASRPEHSIPWTNVNPVGVNTFLSGEVESWKRERTMEMVAESGAGWIRQGFAWSEIEPQQGEHWDAKYQQDAWAKFDDIVALAEAHGVRIIARLDQTPAWARPPGTDAATPPSDPEHFGDFVFDFVDRYQGRISFIQIWNEPNLAREWGGAIDPAGYAHLLEVAARRAREADPNIVILSAPMAMTTENSGRATDEFTYWQALYDLGVADNFDIMSANVYGLSDPFDAEPSASRLNVRRVELLRELAVRNGDAEKAIWFNEYGWNAAPSHFAADQLTWSRVSEQEQAEWTAQGIEYATEQWEWFGVANIWYFRQVGDIPLERADYYFRMVDLEFTPRDVYRTVQALAQQMNIAGPGWHGVLESPISPIGGWALQRDDAAPDGYSIIGDPGETLHIRFEGSAVDLHFDPHISAGNITVTIHDGAMPGDEGSRPHTFSLDGTHSTIRITEDSVDHPASTGPETHTAVITVNNASKLALTAITVNYERSYRLLLGGISLSAIALVGMASLGWRTARPS